MLRNFIQNQEITTGLDSCIVVSLLVNHYLVLFEEFSNLLWGGGAVVQAVQGALELLLFPVGGWLVSLKLDGALRERELVCDGVWPAPRSLGQPGSFAPSGVLVSLQFLGKLEQPWWQVSCKWLHPSLLQSNHAIRDILERCFLLQFYKIPRITYSWSSLIESIVQSDDHYLAEVSDGDHDPRRGNHSEFHLPIERFSNCICHFQVERDQWNHFGNSFLKTYFCISYFWKPKARNQWNIHRCNQGIHPTSRIRCRLRLGTYRGKHFQLCCEPKPDDCLYRCFCNNYSRWHFQFSKIKRISIFTESPKNIIKLSVLGATDLNIFGKFHLRVTINSIKFRNLPRGRWTRTLETIQSWIRSANKKDARNGQESQLLNQMHPSLKNIINNEKLSLFGGAFIIRIL